jgi:serine/threonine protein kinase
VAIHQAGVVHRDLKPHNVLLGPDGPRVIDFGVAKALDVTTTISTRSIGTPAYMAPEQVKGESVTPAVDLFAWGVTMVFAATGQPAFGQDTIPAVAHRIVAGEPHLAGLPDNLQGLVLACLAKDPTRRPAATDLLMRLLGHAAQPAEGPAGAPTMVLGEGAAAAGAAGAPGVAGAANAADQAGAAPTAQFGSTPPFGSTTRFEPADQMARTAPAAAPTAPPVTGGRRTAILAAISAVALAGLIALVTLLLVNRNSGSPPPTPAPAVSSTPNTGGASQPAPVPPPAPSTSTSTATSAPPPTTTSNPPATTSNPPTSTTSQPPATTSAPPSSSAPAPAGS